jgi:hypothetical protein
MRSYPSALMLSDTSHFIDPETPPIQSDDDLNSRLTQMNLSVLGGFLREILKDRQKTLKLSTSIVAVHLKSLQRFYADLPIDFCLQPPRAGTTSRLTNGSSDRQKTSILNIHSLYFGTVCYLLQPSLVEALQAAKEDQSVTHFSLCINSAKELIQLCQEIFDSGYSLSGSFMAL